MSPYQDIGRRVDIYARLYGYEDFLVTISLNGKIITELLLCNNGDLEWENDWWEGEDDVKLLGFMPLSHIKIFASSVQIGRPVFGPDPVLVTMTSIGKYRLEVVPDGTT